MNITRKRVDELREELQARGLDSTGKRPILLRRLRAALDSSPSSTPRLPAQDASTTNSSGHVDTEPQSTPDQSAQATPASTTDEPASAVATRYSVSSPLPVTTRQPVPVSHVGRNLQPSVSGAVTTTISEFARSNVAGSGVQANTTAPLDAEPSKAVERTVEDVVEIAQSKTSTRNNSEAAATDAEGTNQSKDMVGSATNDDPPSNSASIVLGAATTKTSVEATPASTSSPAATMNGRPFRKLQRMVPLPDNETVEEAILRRRKRFGVPADVKIERSDTVVETTTEQVDEKRDDVTEGAATGKDESEEKVEKEAEGDGKSKTDRREGRPKGIVKQKHRGKGKAGTGGRPGSQYRGNSADRFSNDQGGRRRVQDRKSNSGQPWRRRQGQGSVSPARSRGSSPKSGSEVGVRPAFHGRTGERRDARDSHRGRGDGRGRGYGRGRRYGQGRGHGRGRGNSQGQRVVRQDGGRPNNDGPNNDRPNNDGPNNDMAARGKKRRSSGDDDGYRGGEVNRSRANGDGEVNEVVRGRMQRFTAGMPNSSSASARTKDGDGLGADEVDRRLKRQRRFHSSSSRN